MPTSEDLARETMVDSAKAICDSSLEIARAVRNFDNTIKAANAAAKDIKVAGIAVSLAIGVLTLVQIAIQFASA
jgi:biotin synthase-like enzyme